MGAGASVEERYARFTIGILMVLKVCLIVAKHEPRLWRNDLVDVCISPSEFLQDLRRCRPDYWPHTDSLWSRRREAVWWESWLLNINLDYWHRAAVFGNAACQGGTNLFLWQKGICGRHFHRSWDWTQRGQKENLLNSGLLQAGLYVLLFGPLVLLFVMILQSPVTLENSDIAENRWNGARNTSSQTVSQTSIHFIWR